MNTGAARETEKPAVPGKHMRVMVVDDDPMQRKILTMLLQARGYEVISAHNGVEAWEMLQATPVSVVFTDWMMPEMNGLELISKIRKHEFGQYIYVILCTGKDSRGDLIEGIRSGADDFLSKPVNAEELSVRILSAERIIQLEERLAEDKRKLEQANESLSAAYETIRSDLESAAEMQRSLLPPPARLHDLQFEWLFCPAKILGGDLLSFFPLNECTAGFYQIDVSGHGIPAAMFSVLLSKLLTTTPIENSLLKHRINLPPGHEVTPAHRVISELNKRMQGNGDMYFTMVYGMVDVSTGRLSLSQAGHPHPIYVQNGVATTLGNGGFPVGVVAEMDYDLIELNIGQSDRVFLTSDGILECVNAKGQQFGVDRLLRFVEAHNADPLKTLLGALQQEVRDWVGSDEFQDDISVLAIEKL